ncbi:MAG: sodium/solute symporter [Verrucomicrobiae bacterium]|nr:sodium/solute symporter [Verrucomicrobiae bacterium]
MTALDWLIVLGLNGGVVLYGLFLARGTSTPGEWFLGNRSLVWWTIGLSMFATNIDNADIVSLTGTSFKEGFHIIAVHTLGALAGGIVAAFFLLPAMMRAGHFTNAEYLEARFGVTTRVLSALIQIQYRTSMLGLMIWSVFLLMTKFLGLTPAVAWVFIIALVALAALYTTWGGLKAVVFTDAFQAVIMFVGTGVIVYAVARAAGGLGNLHGALEKAGTQGGQTLSDLAHMGRYFGDRGDTLPIAVFIGWVIIGGGYWTVNHTQTMRLLGARSLWDMKMAALFGVTISMPIMIACSSIGIFGRALFPDFDPPDALYPYLADRYLGPGWKGLVVAGIVAAAVSTFDSMGSSLSAIFTRDIYARLLVKDRDDSHYLKVTRWATIAILAIGFAYLPFIMSKDTMLKAFLTLIPVFVTPLFTIYLFGVFTRAHFRAGLCGILFGGAYGLLALWDREVADIGWLAPWFTGRWVALSWSMGFTLLGGGLATQIWGRCPAEAMEGKRHLPHGGWLERSSEHLGPLPDHPFRDGVPVFLNPALVAAVLVVVTSLVLLIWFW